MNRCHRIYTGEVLNHPTYLSLWKMFPIHRKAYFLLLFHKGQPEPFAQCDWDDFPNFLAECRALFMKTVVSDILSLKQSMGNWAQPLPNQTLPASSIQYPHHRIASSYTQKLQLDRWAKSAVFIVSNLNVTMTCLQCALSLSLCLKSSFETSC